MRRRALVLLLAAVVLWPGTSRAHRPFDPRVRVVVDSIAPAAPEIRALASFEVQGLPPRMTVRNDGAAVLEILGPGGEPLFRIGPSGTQGNTRSPAYRAAVDPLGVTPSPTPIDKRGADTTPSWRILTHEPVWRWFEDRADLHTRVPASIASQPGPVDLASWHIPARFNGRSLSIRGRVVWKVPSGSVRTRILPARWAPEGVDIRTLPGPVPGIQLRNTTETPVEIAGRDGVAFARVSRSGAEVNIQSVTWSDTKGLPEPAVDGPSWRQETELPVLIWIERRAAYEQPDPPADIERAAREAVLLRWEIPARYGGRSVVIEGETYWRPLSPARDSSVSPAVAGGIVSGIALVAGLALRRRQLGNSRASG